ncbi:MAG: DUF2207 domain-containing protein [Ferruginibacter sp.]
MKLKNIFYCIVLLLVCVNGMAQFPGFTKASDYYFSDGEYEELIRKAAIETASNENISESVVTDNYVALKDVIESISRPVITKKFSWLETGIFSKPAKGTAAFDKRKDAYIHELQRGVRDALLANNIIFDNLKKIDQSDRILSFHSDITINKNGMYSVVETIKIYNGDGGYGSMNDEIKRGITRSFPTRYTNNMGMISTVPFRIKKVQKNNVPEPYFTKRAENGIIIYVGNSDQFLKPGIYTYEISYETERQIIFHNDKDECYWNVNGNGWSFNCEKASCTIHFPGGAKVFESKCYTGLQGSVSQNCTCDSTNSNTISFRSNKKLEPYEGLTVAASIQKGIIAAPSSLAKLLLFLKDNLTIPLLLLAAIFLFVFNFRLWRRVGKDPKGGTIIPQFQPPANMSAADTGYLLEQRYGAHLFAASVVDHAVQHRLNIEVKQEGILFKTPAYYFQRPADLKTNNRSDNKLYEWYGYDIDRLYGQTAARGSYNSQLASVYNGMEEQLKKRLLIRKGIKNSFKGLFSLNTNYAWVGVLLIFLLSIGSIIYLTFFHSTGLVICTIGLIIICIIIQAIFMKIMSAYTPEGRAVADHVLGFKMYLETAEQLRFDKMNPPEMTIQLFEKYLPYAIALKCENAWSAKFEDVISKATAGGYQPTYFYGGTTFHVASFTSGISSGLASTISSASTPPSSSSGGSSGGGSSGGGGGGGGGGGW